MNNITKSFKLKPVTAAVLVATAALGSAPALAGPGNIPATSWTQPNFLSAMGTVVPGNRPTFYANSPAGNRIDPVTGLAVNTGTPLRKFVDTLPGLGAAGANNLGEYLPQAVPDTTSYTIANGYGNDADYYELGIVEYAEKVHSDLPKATTFRGYVQIDRAMTNAGYILATNTVVAAPAASVGSLGVKLTYPNGTPVKVALEDARHNIVRDALGKPIMVQAYAYDKPHYLGPIIVATGGKAVRVKYSNLLPTGRATTDPLTGVVTRNGDLFLPFDETLTGAGQGWVQDTATTGHYEKYLQNRAMIHLHGGLNPWISDGTPHQWTVPVGETAASPNNMTGASFQNVPDMPDPGQGAGTLYWTNAQSARLMFYHDHTVAQTRLNVYAGMAAGYLITDPAEQTLIKGGTFGTTAIAPGTLPDIGIPLVIEDKTFVPADIAKQDSKWRTDAWGAPGDLWFPHVYEPNQDPNSASTSYTNPVGRWDYGLWFWPVFPATMALPTGDYKDALGNSQVTTTAEGFMDTPTVNGTAYPTLTVQPKGTRFRILNASNDRFFNLQLYVADPAQVSASGVANTEVKMVQAVPSLLPDCAITADGSDTLVQPLRPAINPATGLPYAQPAGAPATGPGSCWPINWPTDGRVGGVPDPSTAGPTMWQIGSESGFLPTVAPVPAVPVNYDYNRRSVTVLNVSQNNDPTQACANANGGHGACHGLYMGPAERADVVIDFSPFAGKTLILYSDAPAPNPGYDPRIDYYTGDPDQALGGGAPTTLAGYGPNIRTIMQIKVANTAPQPYNVAALQAALPLAYAASKDKPIVAESAYDKAFGTTATPLTGDQLARIFFGSSSQPQVSWTDGNGVLRTYCVPSVVGGALAPLPVGCDGPILNKAIQELFDNYGRMNATLGTELPATKAATQTTLPFGYIDPNTETLPAGQTQIWKITHNGVDAHPVHFHLLDVQLINRVGWDGTVKPPEPGELGWKETIKMNPLEDIVVAVRPKVPPLPGFGLPRSLRLMDPSQPKGGALNFMGLNPYDGTPTVVTNQVVDYDWEYVWHCHILGHEENDFMRPMTFTGVSVAPTASTIDPVTRAYPPTLLPGAPSGVLAGLVGLGTAASPYAVALTWVDNSTNEYRFDILRAALTTSTGTAIASPVYSVVGSALANAKAYTDTTVSGGIQYSYMVRAVAAGGTADSLAVTMSVPGAAPAAPTGLTLSAPVFVPPVAPAVATTAAPGTFTLTAGWTNTAANVSGFDLERCLGTAAACATGVWTPVASTTGGTATPGTLTFTVPATATSEGDAGLLEATAYSYRVRAVNQWGGSAYSNVASTTTPYAPAVAPATLAASAVTPTSLILTWSNAAPQTAINVSCSTTTAGAVCPAPLALAAGTGTTSITGLTQNASYVFTVTSVNGPLAGLSATAVPTTAAATVAVTTPFAATAAPSGLNATAITPTSLTLNWTGVTPVTAYQVQRCAGAACVPVTIATIPSNVGGALSYNDTGLTQATGYTYVVAAVNGTLAPVPSLPLNAITNFALSGGMQTLTAFAPTATTATLQFAANAASGPVTGFVIDRTGGPAGTVFTKAYVANTGGTLTWTDPTVAASSTYTYSVTPYNAALGANGLPDTTIRGGNAGNPVLSAPVTTPVAALAAAVTSTSTASSITLSLSSTGGTASSFVISRCLASVATGGTCPAAGTTALGTVAASATGTATFSDTGLVSGTAYLYSVQAVAGAVTGPATMWQASTLSSGIVVGSPTNLTTNIGNNPPQVNLNWQVGSTNTTSFLVMRSTDGVNFAQVGTVQPGNPVTVGAARGFTDNTVVTGTTYYYYVVAQNVTAGVTTLSAPSATVTANFGLPAAVGPLTASAIGGQTFTVSWAAVAGATRYDVYLGGVLDQSVTTPTITYSGMTEATAYTVAIVASNAAGSAASSPVLTVTTAPLPPDASAVNGAAPGTIAVSWTSTNLANTVYTVQMQSQAPGAAGFGPWATVGTSTTTSFLASGLTTGWNYQFQVSATVGGVANSGYGGQVSQAVTAQ